MMTKTILLGGIALFTLGPTSLAGNATPWLRSFQLVEDGKQQPRSMAGNMVPWLGVKVDIIPIPAEFAKHLGLEPGQGARISNIVAGSPAEKAGLERDDIILSVQGTKAAGAVSIITALDRAGIGAQISLEVLHLGQRKTVQAQVGSLPQGDPGNTGLKYPMDDFDFFASPFPGSLYVVGADGRLVYIGNIQGMGLSLDMIRTTTNNGQMFGTFSIPASGGMRGMPPYPGGTQGGYGLPQASPYSGGQANLPGMPSTTPNSSGTPGGCSISGVVLIEGPQMAQTNVRKLLVVAFEPVLNMGQVTGATRIHYGRLSAFQQQPLPFAPIEGVQLQTMSQASWTIDGLTSGTGYIIHLVYDQNGNGVFDMGTDQVLASPSRFSPMQTTTAPAQGITLIYQPAWPMALP
jgi:membrane-associated protease RseP (regulator of RpoE activity)